MRPVELERLRYSKEPLRPDQIDSLFAYIDELHEASQGHLRIMAELTQDIASQIVARDLTEKFVAKYREKLQ